MDFLFLVLLILLNGVFALAEMAIVSSRRPRLKAMADRGNRGARAALRLLDDPSKLLSTVQIGITAIGVIAGAYGATALSDDFAPVVADLLPSLERYAPAIAFGTVIVITTFLSLVLGELIPKRIALSAPEPLAALMAPVMRFIETIASPVVWLLRTVTEGLVRLLGLHRTRQEDVTEEELQSLIEEGEKAGVIEEEEREMIEGVMRLGDRSVKAIMTPRTEMVWLDPGMPKDEILKEISDSGHSRFPVAAGDADEIIGVVQTKELFSHLAATGSVDLKAVMHPPVFVPETMPVLRLLEAMRGNPVRMVMVSDEYGAVLGIVTAADLLESIAGDSALSEDEGLTPPVLRDDGSWLIDGMTPVDEFEQLVGVRGLDEDEGYSTVAGLVMHLMRAVPSEGDKAERPPLTFEVLDMDGRRIDKVLVRKFEPVDEDSTG
ncbi:MAG TPA: hemolysin family protein [Hyphomonadaceae bacterium]|nr:hemolysin family protein [Hyphomonadaceae bacterium]